MLTHRPFRFGVLTFGATTRHEWRSQAQEAEALGYDTFLVDDHLNRLIAPIAALMAAADATPVIRIGSCVFGNDFRHPAILAKEAATLDVLSDGRLELGIGTGYARADYDQPGITFDPPAIRVGRFREAVTILKRVFTNDTFTFCRPVLSTSRGGVHSQTCPASVSPLFIGGGDRQMLTIAAREGDIVGVNARTTPAGTFDYLSVTAEATAQKVAWIRAAAAERLSALEMSLLVPFLSVTDQPQQMLEHFRESWQIADHLTAEQVRLSPHTLIGSLDYIVELLQERRETYGFSYVVVFEYSMREFSAIVARLRGS
jgi:probable F420-dependent oxidoreductase